MKVWLGFEVILYWYSWRADFQV